MFTKILTSALLFLIAIGGFFVSIENNSIYGISSTSAADGGETTIMANGTEIDNTASKATTKPSEAESKWLNEAIQAVNAILAVITVILSPAIIFAGWLMSPDWTSGDLFGLREPMHNMWIIVSNIVYFIYAILLIIIALATIFGKDNFSYKAMIPRLALGILMVPFTWWFVQWTISLATVVTASVINIPMETMMDQYSQQQNRYLNEPLIPKNYTITTLAGGTGSTTTSSKCTEANGCLSIQDILNSDGGIYNTLLIYAYNVFKIQDYKSIDSINGKISTAGQILNNVVISAIMLLVFGLLVMALIAMLLLRAIKLWMYAIFSPLFTLHFVAGKELFGKSTEGFDLKEFIGLCFVPAVVGLTLSFGLMIVSIVQIPAQNSSTTNTTCDVATMNTLRNTDGNYSGGCVMAHLMGTTTNTISRGVEGGAGASQTGVITDVISIGGMNIVFKGLSTNISKSAETANTVNGAFSTAGGIFGTIIIDIIALIFIWMAFMAAKGISKAVDAAVQPFEDMGKKVGSMAASIPKYTPIPGLGMSASGITQIGSKIESNIQAAQQNKLADSKLGQLVGMSGSMSNELRNLNDKIRNGGSGVSADILRAQRAAAQNEKTDQNKQEAFLTGVNNLVAAFGGKEKIDNTQFREKLRDGFGLSDLDQTNLIKALKADTLDKSVLKNDPKISNAYKSYIGGGDINSPGGVNNGSPGITATKISDNSVNISIDGGKLATVKISEDNATIDAKSLAALVDGKENIMTKDAFIQAMMKGGMTDKAAGALATEITNKNNKFFK